MRPRNRRRSRPKPRRTPKYLSLRRHLTSPTRIVDEKGSPNTDDDEVPKLINSSSSSAIADLDRDLNVSCLLDGAAGGVGEVPTLADLLGDDVVVPESSGSQSAASSINWGGDDGDVLARRALRGRERWVYCRLSAASPADEEVASSGDGWWCGVSQVGLALKLNHEQILSEWSDRGSLYIDGEAPLVVPQMQQTAGIPVLVEVECRGGDKKVEGLALDGDRTVVIEGISREERVMRYREKRRNRLFAKKIRYEVRKLNAEKRPRWKGRFIKRLDDDNEDIS